jgi:hypothetical protein
MKAEEDETLARAPLPSGRGSETTTQAAKPPLSLGTLVPAFTLGLRATFIKTMALNPLRRIRSLTKKTFRGARLCGVPSERGFFCRAGFPGFCTLGWYAMPIQGMGWGTWLGHGIGKVVVDWPQRSRADTLERDA